jgi:hypothetical protein
VKQEQPINFLIWSNEHGAWWMPSEIGCGDHRCRHRVVHHHNHEVPASPRWTAGR